MTASLAGKVAIVTGEAAELGLGVVQKFLAAGAGSPGAQHYSDEELCAIVDMMRCSLT